MTDSERNHMNSQQSNYHTPSAVQQIPPSTRRRKCIESRETTPVNHRRNNQGGQGAFKCLNMDAANGTTAPVVRYDGDDGPTYQRRTTQHTGS